RHSDLNTVVGGDGHSGGPQDESRPRGDPLPLFEEAPPGGAHAAEVQRLATPRVLVFRPRGGRSGGVPLIGDGGGRCRLSRGGRRRGGPGNAGALRSGRRGARGGRRFATSRGPPLRGVYGTLPGATPASALPRPQCTQDVLERDRSFHEGEAQ